ncbi:hypothetical protein EX30DRAFT_343665 [Ascodesmis nigricans]|uniref:Uncharacterized protein n=1 Tax=Ascodesmis nigricans TaxID=341454 RepID=A0A4S2MRU4_9PEZI|nr:hypothetical protein EX30DRAFT_343665 [Ascodesmis nigricans]
MSCYLVLTNTQHVIAVLHLIHLAWSAGHHPEPQQPNPRQEPRPTVGDEIPQCARALTSVPVSYLPRRRRRRRRGTCWVSNATDGGAAARLDSTEWSAELSAELSSSPPVNSRHSQCLGVGFLHRLIMRNGCDRGICI